MRSRASQGRAPKGGLAPRTRAMRVGRLRLPQIAATIRPASGNPHPPSGNAHHDADLRRFSARPFRHIRTAPCHSRGDACLCRRVRSAADASRRRGSIAIDAEGPLRFGLASLLDHDADDVRLLYRPHRVAGLAGRQRIALARAASAGGRSHARCRRCRGKGFPQPSGDWHRDVQGRRPQRGGTGLVRNGLADHRTATRWYRGGTGRLVRFFEDIEIGQRREVGSFTFTADLIKKFAGQFDPQRFHLDEEEGRKSLFGGLAASGWHVGSVCMKLLVADGQRHAKEAAARGEAIAVWGPSPGFRELRWIKPVLADDTLSFASEVESLRSSDSRPEWGILQARNTGTNQHGELVFSFLASAFVPRRNAGS